MKYMKNPTIYPAPPYFLHIHGGWLFYCIYIYYILLFIKGIGVKNISIENIKTFLYPNEIPRTILSGWVAVRSNMRYSVNMLKLKDFQLAKKELERELKKFRGNKAVTVGIHEGAGAVPDGNINMATLGAVLNFGTDDGHIPPRPWLEPGVASGTQEYLQIISNGIKNGGSLESVLDTVGVVAVGKVQEFMTELSSPANAASTVATKGSTNPLINEGHLRGSVTYQITSDKLEEGLS